MSNSSSNNTSNSMRRTVAVIGLGLLAVLGLTQAGAATLQVNGSVPVVFTFPGPTPSP